MSPSEHPSQILVVGDFFGQTADWLFMSSISGTHSLGDGWGKKLTAYFFHAGLSSQHLPACRVAQRNWQRARRVCWTPRWQEPAKLSRENWSFFGSGRNLRAKSDAWRRRRESLVADKKPSDTLAEPGIMWNLREKCIALHGIVIADWNLCCR